MATLLIVTASSGATAQAVPVAPMTQAFTNGKHWLLHTAMVYRIGETRDSVIVPAGFVTDHASIPPYLQSIVQTNSPNLLPSIIHDYLYWEQSCTRDQADRIFRIAMIETETPWLARSLAYTAVKQFGAAAYRANAEAKARGRPRIIPQERRSLPTKVPWESYQDSLFALGVRPGAEIPVAREFCAWGEEGANPPGIPQ